MFLGIIGFTIASITPNANKRIIRLIHSLGMVIVVVEVVLWGFTQFQIYFWQDWTS